MLSSLQDISGLFPGLFQRGEGAAADKAASEQAARGLGQGHGRGHRQHVDHGHHGRDRVSLSREAEAVQQAADAAEDTDSVGDAVAAETEGQSLLGQAGSFVRQALETIRADLGEALKAFGFDSAAIENFTQAFVEPVLTALKEGVNFTAELSFAAFSQVTAVSAGGVSQATSLVAQSLSIEVNQDTGEVNVSVAKLSFDQQIQSSTGNGDAPLLVIDPDDLLTPQELAAKILQGGTSPLAEPAASTEEAAAAAEEAAEETVGGEDATENLDQTLAEVRDRLAESAVQLQTRLTIYSVSTYQNDKGETITKLLLDAQLNIAGLANNARGADAQGTNAQGTNATAQEEAESLNLTA
ncbi:MAG: hypothetical protein ACFB13_03940 [Kiloniellaceae bacterium]